MAAPRTKTKPGVRLARWGGILVLALLAGTLGAARAQAQPAQTPLPACGGPDAELNSSLPLLQVPAVASAVHDTITALSNARTTSNLPGFAVAVVHDQDMVFSAGFGCADTSRQTPNTPETLFDVGSITKIFTAVMLMQLRDAGMLSLDDPASQYYPTAQFLSVEGMPVSATFRQLVDHTSGLERNMPPPAPAGINELFSRLASEQAKFDPSAGFLYSNLAYAVLGQVLAQVAGQPYEQYVVQHILQPLGMNTSGFGPTQAMLPLMANGYGQAQVNPPVVSAPGAPLQFGGVIDPAAGMISSADELAQFLMLQFRTADPVLSGSSLAEMVQPQVTATETDSQPAPTGAAAGLGWFNLTGNAVPFYYKDGATAGFCSYMMILPNSKVGIVVVVNKNIIMGQTPPATTLATMIANNLAVVIRTNAQ